MTADEKNFDKCMTIWKNVSKLIKVNFDSELTHNMFYLKARKNATQKKI